MARRLQLTWVTETGRPGRWRKIYRGRMYYFDGGRGKTDLDAYRAALEAFEAVKRRVMAESARADEPSYAACLEQWSQVLPIARERGEPEMAELAADMIATLRRRLNTPGPLPELSEQDWLFQRLRYNREQFAVWEDRLNGLNRSERAQTLQVAADTYLEGKLAEQRAGAISAARYHALQQHVRHFLAWDGTGLRPLEDVGSPLLIAYRTHLLGRVGTDWTATTAGHYINDTCTFVRWLWESELIEHLPRIFRFRKIAIEREPVSIRVIPVADLQRILAAASPRTRLCALLAVNCGMVQSDLANLRKSEIDLESGVITRKRSKTRKEERVPVVSYMLWPETVALLREQIEPGGDYALLNRDGRQLARSAIEGGQLAKWDSVNSAWRRVLKKLELAYPFKLLRKTAASLLGDSEYADIVELFLGHAPSTVARRHYAQPPEQRLAAALGWLRLQLLAPDRTGDTAALPAGSTATPAHSPSPDGRAGDD